MPVGLCLSRVGCVRANRSSTDEFLKKEYLVNKNIVHLIDDIFWHRKDKDSKFRLILIESRVHRLGRYYKKVGKLPPNWR